MDMGEDLLSGLPDELLHAILVRLGSARAAARTSVLSRRWRHVWPHMPELLLDLRTEAPPASFLDAVDGALVGCLAPTLERLTISLPAGCDLTVPRERAALWLRFAAERVAGELGLIVPLGFTVRLPAGDRTEETELEVPVCDRAKGITLFPQDGWLLRLQPAGLFRALTAMRILGGRMEGSELSTLVCKRCPRLTDLRLSVVLVTVADVSIRSDSLRSLWFYVMNTRLVEVVAPRLEELTLYHSVQAHVSAPNLAKLVWHGGTYDPHSHRFHDVGRRLWLLRIGLKSGVTSLMRQFAEVDVLELGISIRQGIAGYQSFLNETKMLQCKTLCISLYWNHHGLAPIILHLLRSCNGTRKFSLTLYHLNYSLIHRCPSFCPCCLEESRRTNNIDLNSLDEVEISSFKISNVEQEFLEALSRCNARTTLKKLVINCKMSTIPPETKEVCKKVRGMYGSNVEVEFYMFPDGTNGRRERFY